MRWGLRIKNVLRGRRTSAVVPFPSALGLLIATLTLLLAAGSMPAQEDEEGGAPPDTTLSPDSLSAPPDSLEDDLAPDIPSGEEEERSGFHPRYSLSFKDNRDSRTWQQNVRQLSFSLGERLTLSTGISSNSKKSKNVEQETLARRSTSEISYALTPSVSILAHLNLNASESRTHVGTRNISTDNFDIGTAFDRSWGEKLEAQFEINGGTAGNRNPHFETRGTQGAIKSHFSHQPWSWVTATVDHEASLARQRSRVRDGEGETLDRERENTVTGSLALTLPYRSSLRVNWTVDSGRFQRPDTIEVDPLTGERLDSLRVGQETKTLSNRSIGLNADLRPIEDLQVTISGNWARRLTDYALQTWSYVLGLESGGKIAAKYRLPTETDLGISLSSNESRSEYRPQADDPDRTGSTIHRTLNGSLSQALGRKADLDIRGTLDLRVYEYDHPESYDRDRDLLDKKLTVGGSYNPLSALSLRCDLSILDQRTVNIMNTQSAQNFRSRSYSLKPSFTFRLQSGIAISQNYTLDATYRDYTFNESRNQLTRIAGLTTSFGYSFTPRLKISASHTYRDSDQGRYSEESPGDRRFSPQSQNERQEMNIGLNYSPWNLLSLHVSQRLQLDRRWTFNQGRRIPQADNYNQYLSGEVKGGLKSRHFTLSYKLALNVGDGALVPEKQQRYWTASVDLSYTY